MKINFNTHSMSFTAIPMKKVGSFNVIDEKKLNNQIKTQQNGDLFLKSEHEPPSEELSNKEQHFLSFAKGSDSEGFPMMDYVFIKNENTILAEEISVPSELQKEGLGLGSKLMLYGIVTALSNHEIESITLYSLPETVLFYAKLKFDTNFENIACLKNFAIKNLPEKIGRKVNAISNSKYFTDETKLNKGNEILSKYLQNLATKGKDEQTKNYTPRHVCKMILTKDHVYENKEFYNNLFTKHGIDYEI